jgi:hypothetical protein
VDKKTIHFLILEIHFITLEMNCLILVSSSMLIDFLTGGLTPNNGHYSYIVLPNNVWRLVVFAPFLIIIIIIIIIIILTFRAP